MKHRKDKWNSFAMRGYSHDVANDQTSAGGTHTHQVKKTKAGWLVRIRQSNGSHTAYSQSWPVSDLEGEAAFESAKTY